MVWVPLIHFTFSVKWIKEVADNDKVGVCTSQAS